MPRVYMRFKWMAGWRVSFQNEGVALPRTLLFQSEEKLEELAHRGGGLKGLADKQAFEHAIRAGHGGIYLHLSETQLGALQTIAVRRILPVRADRMGSEPGVDDCAI